jgi:sec-independent protein translocase protein TatB
VFENLNAWEFGGLLLVALLIFGDKLPKVIGDGMRLLRNLRQMATNATGDLSRELGTDISIDDLNPKNFVRKHLLSEDDENAIRRPLQSLYDDVRKDVNSHVNDVRDATSVNTPLGGQAPQQSAAITRTSYDDAT